MIINVEHKGPSYLVAIDAEEMKTMEESFRKRREGSQALARDPIVYGVAATDGAFVIRTGTRLFCVGGN